MFGLISRIKRKLYLRLAVGKGAVGLDALKTNWEALARHDPMWAILSDPAKMGGGWDREEFFETGRHEIGALMEYIGGLGAVKPVFERALDFGCGVGRLTQALGRYYAKVDGIDISSEMVRQARDYNTLGDRVVYTVNTAALLPYPDDSFDLVYSNIVLQHMEKRYALGYIEEFVRVIKPAGLAVFQAPSGHIEDKGDRFAMAVETDEGVYSQDMNVIPQKDVLAALERAGGRVLDITPYDVAGPAFESLRYAVTKG